MEIAIIEGNDELFIDHQEGSVGFTVLTKEGNQHSFSIDIDEWIRLKTFIDDDISIYQGEQLIDKQTTSK